MYVNGSIFFISKAHVFLLVSYYGFRKILHFFCSGHKFSSDQFLFEIYRIQDIIDEN